MSKKSPLWIGAVAFILCVVMTNSLALDHLTATTSFNTPQNPEKATQGDVLIFVSFSMPEGSLQQWLAQAGQIHAPVIIRGLIDNSFEETQTKIAALIPNNQGGVVLEPRLFSDYQITQVPAVVVRNTAIDCSLAQSCPHIYPFDVITGDVGLDAALTAIADQPDSAAASDVAHQALQRLRQDQ